MILFYDPQTIFSLFQFLPLSLFNFHLFLILETLWAKIARSSFDIEVIQNDDRAIFAQKDSWIRKK